MLALYRAPNTLKCGLQPPAAATAAPSGRRQRQQARHLVLRQQRTARSSTSAAGPCDRNISGSGSSMRLEASSSSSSSAASGSGAMPKRSTAAAASSTAASAATMAATTTAAPAAASTAPTAKAPSAPAASASCRVRPAENADWWAIADLHCCAFYPRATPFWFSTLRLDRVMALQLGAEQPSDIGRFMCLVADASDAGSSSSGSSEDEDTSSDAAAWSSSRSSSSGSGGNGTATPAPVPGVPAATAAAQAAAAAQGRVELGPLVDLVVRLFFPAYMRQNYAATYAAQGLRGAVVIDTMGLHLPRKRKEMPNGSIREVRRKGICYLSNLAVAPCTRRAGVGRKLLQEAEAVAVSWGCRTMALHVDPTNTAAVEMYRRAGYRHIMSQPEWQRMMEGRDHPLSLMMRALPWEGRQAAVARQHQYERKWVPVRSGGL